jgi:predicted nucleic acid-binding protein
LQALFNLSYWDALIVATALQQGCTHLLSEDLQAGLLMGGMLVVNPFLLTPEGL